MILLKFIYSQTKRENPLIRYINWLSPEQNIKEFLTEPTIYDPCLAEGLNKRQYYIFFSSHYQGIIDVTSILQIKRKGQRTTYLINGQASKNTKAVLPPEARDHSLIIPRTEMKKFLEEFHKTNSGLYIQRWEKTMGNIAHETQYQIIKNLFRQSQEKPILLP